MEAVIEVGIEVGMEADPEAGAGPVPGPGRSSVEDTRFESVFREARPQALALVRRVVEDSEAEDVVQEAFVRLAAAPVLDRPDAEVTAWLRRVCLNLAFNRVRDVGRWRERTERAGRLSLVRGGDAGDPAAASVRADERARVRGVLAGLPDKQRDALLLRHSGYAYAEIAATLDMPTSSVGTTLARAERAFRAAYESRETSPEGGAR